MTLAFITGNAGKFREIADIIPNLTQHPLDLDEIQSLNARTVIGHKLTQAAALYTGAFIVEDTSLELHCLGGYPGTMIKWLEQSIGTEGIADLVLRYDNHRATAITTIGYRGDNGEEWYATGRTEGTIVAPTISDSFGWNSIFMPTGASTTFAGMSIAEKNNFSMRGIAARKLRDHLKEA